MCGYDTSSNAISPIPVIVYCTAPGVGCVVESFVSTGEPGICLPARIGVDLMCPLGSSIGAVDSVRRLAGGELVSDDTRVGAVVVWDYGVDASAGSGGGVASDVVKSTVVSVFNGGDSSDHSEATGVGWFSVELFPFPAVAFIMVGIGLEAISNGAAILFEYGAKASSWLFLTSVWAVSADFESMSGRLFLAMVLVGSDVSI